MFYYELLVSNSRIVTTDKFLSVNRKALATKKDSTAVLAYNEAPDLNISQTSIVQLIYNEAYKRPPAVKPTALYDEIQDYY